MIMRQLLIVMALVCSLQMTAQVNRISLRCLYLEEYVKDAKNPNQIKQDEFALDIEEGGESVFYSVYERRIKEQRDSMVQIGMTASEIINEQRDLPRTHQYFEYYKNLSEKGKYTCFDKVVKLYSYEEALPVLNWSIVEETKEILGYKCQMATTRIDNRSWVVWFTMDIPISDGPWLLTGLPGLILEASDSENIFHFKAIELKKQTVDVNLPKNVKCIKTSRKEFLAFRKKYNENPENGLRNITGYNIQITGADGKRFEGRKSSLNYFEKE